MSVPAWSSPPSVAAAESRMQAPLRPQAPPSLQLGQLGALASSSYHRMLGLMAGDLATTATAEVLQRLTATSFTWCDKDRALPALPPACTSGELVAALADLARRHGRCLDVLLLSAGMHDCGRDAATFELALPLGVYQRNLVELVQAARGVSLQVMWLLHPGGEHGTERAASCDDCIGAPHGGAAALPAQNGCVWLDTDVQLYQTTARDVMWRFGVQVSSFPGG
jgi:hypothetical protein